MERIKSILKELEIDHLVDEQLLKEFKIKKFKENTIILSSGETSDRVMKILKGEVKAQLYTDEDGIFYNKLREGDFFGFIFTILDKPVVPDFIAAQETEVLMFPLKKIMTTRKDIMDKLWAKAAVKTAQEANNIITKALSRLTSSNEAFFLKYLENNKGMIDFSSTRELSENLNIHLRTLQRIIKKLSEKGIIEKSRKRIKIKDRELFQREKEIFII